jgi:hypothetical protein
MRLREISGGYAIARLDAGDAIPSWARGAFVSITRTHGELSIVCDESAMPEGVAADRGWRCLEIEGPLPLDQIGIAAAVTTVLADAGVSVFPIATYDTDYVLVKEQKLERAVAALRGAGHDVVAL